jgi:uncharacterized Zn finger protein
MNREDLVTILGSNDKKMASGKTKPAPTQEDDVELPSDISKFWNGEPLPEDILGEVRIPPVAAALPKRLGSFPFWRGETKFLDAMESIYTKASAAGLRVFLGETVDHEENLKRDHLRGRF